MRAAAHNSMQDGNSFDDSSNSNEERGDDENCVHLLHLDGRGVIQFFELLEESAGAVLQRVMRVEVGHLGGRQVEVEVGSVIPVR
jgi:hypothetical protein